jgi:hypothetical protein
MKTKRVLRARGNREKQGKGSTDAEEGCQSKGQVVKTKSLLEPDRECPP